tara:strand:- start:39 stop:329 length:291 start_codon:yes stop_codon:yes gene_type:complete
MYKIRDFNSFSNLDIQVEIEGYESFWLEATDYINDNDFSISYRGITFAYIIYRVLYYAIKIDLEVSVIECLHIAKKNINTLDDLTEDIYTEQINKI